MKASVGRSHRTPAKHALMSRVFGSQVGAVNSMRPIRVAQWFDLTAGDGVVNEDAQGGWERNCSPGIAAYHARKCEKPVSVTLYERQAATFDRLQQSLAEHLPGLGYRQVANWWLCGNARIRTVLGSGAEASVDGIIRSTSVVVTNDPNAITDWAMRPTFAAEICELTSWFVSISTMGCNPAGLKRLKIEDRQHWFGHVERQAETLPAWRDLLLAAIENDDSQWAYLLCEPVKWRDRVGRDVNRAFGSHDLTVNFAWLRTEPDRFAEIEQRLFLTKKERSAS